MAQQSWGLTLPGRSPAAPLNRHELRTAAAHRLLSLDVMLVLLAFTGGLRLIQLANRAPALNSESATAAHTYAAGHFTAFADSGGLAASPFGWLQLAAYTLVSGSFEREPTAIAAVREAMVVAAVLGALLGWILARRLGLPRWAATTAVLLAAASPFAIGLQRIVAVEQLAVVWALAGLSLICTPSSRARPWHDVLAGLFLLAAILTSPLALFLLPAAGWLLLRNRVPARAGLTAVVLTFGLGVAFGPAGRFLRPGLSWADVGGQAGSLWLDPGLAVLSAAALIASLFVTALRPLALSGLLLTAALCWPGSPSAGLLTLLLALTPLLIAGTAHAVATRQPRPGRHRTGLRRPLLLTVSCLVVTAGLGAGWAAGYAQLGLQNRPDEPLVRAGNWLRDNAAGATLFVDDAAWAQLASDGWPTGALVSPAACGAACPPAEWSVSTSAMAAARQRSSTVDGELTDVTTVAAFGAGDERVTIGRVDVQPAVPEGGTWARAGAALTSSPALTAQDDTAALLRQGKVDPRLLATVAAMLALHPVRIVAFPEVAGEDAAGQPRRQALIIGDDTAEFYRGQRDVFRPNAVTRTAGGVLVTYPPLPPSGLLTPFTSP